MIAVLGAGNWGTTLADLIASNGHAVRLWTRDPAQRDEVWIDRLRRGRANPGDALPMWMGARARVGRGPLALADRAGQPVMISSPASFLKRKAGLEQ